jgi:pimeloyl-ACP methyl ester carboxylesterase
VVVELLGHGRAQAPDDPAAYRVEAYFARFETLRRELGAERWALCGQSFGAGLTLGYSLAHPDRVIGQVFTNSASALATSNPNLTDEMRRARAEAFRRGGRASLEAMPFYPKRTGRLAKAIEDELAADAELISLPGVAHAISDTLPGLAVNPRLAEIATPTLLVNGRREKAFQPLRDLAAREIPGLQVADLDGGHPINLDQPEAFNAAVSAFLQGL